MTNLTGAGDDGPHIDPERYTTEGKLGEGGMAEVWLVYDRYLQRRVAVKVMRDAIAGDQANVARFRDEARAAAGLHHAHIVQVFEAGEFEGTPFIVMQFVDGRTLDDAVAEKERRPVSARWAAQIGVNVAEALHHAHERGVIHRDIKPSNLILDRDDQVSVTDFGIARTLNNPKRHTRTGWGMGSAEYISPEGVRGEDVDGRADIYSLGVVLYELAAGQLPFKADRREAIAWRHGDINDLPPKLGELAPATPAGYVAVVEKAMAKNRDDRYGTAAQLADALRDQVLRPTSQQPAPAPTPPRPAPQAGPHPRRLLLGAVALLVLGALIALLATSGGGGTSTTSTTHVAVPTTPVPPTTAPTTTTPPTTAPASTAPPTTLPPTTTTTAPPLQQVSLDQLCYTLNAACDLGTLNLADGQFSYDYVLPLSNVGTIPASSCTTFELTYIFGNDQSTSPPSGTATLHAALSPGESVTGTPVSYGHRGNLSVTANGQAVELTSQGSVVPFHDSTDIFVGGYGMCTTNDGAPGGD